ncbi:MAG: hypothetical protein IJ723_05445 [Ruminococcus sp.]|nr:hypothetical protein [Ruminococcus sp.]
MTEFEHNKRAAVKSCPFKYISFYLTKLAEYAIILYGYCICGIRRWQNALRAYLLEICEAYFKEDCEATGRPSQGVSKMSVMEILTLLLLITNIVALVVTICNINRKK